jgi:hypothetical protein
MKRRERDLARTKKVFEDVRQVYERSQKVIEGDISEWERRAASRGEEVAERRARIEKEFRMEIEGESWQETCRYAEVEHSRGAFEKTTPRSARPNLIDSEKKMHGGRPKVPKLPISNINSNKKVTPPLKKA